MQAGFREGITGTSLWRAAKLHRDAPGAVDILQDVLLLFYQVSCKGLERGESKVTYACVLLAAELLVPSFRSASPRLMTQAETGFSGLHPDSQSSASKSWIERNLSGLNMAAEPPPRSGVKDLLVF